MDGHSDFALCAPRRGRPRAACLRRFPLIGVYGYWYSAGFSPAFPQAHSPRCTPAPRPAQPFMPNVYSIAHSSQGKESASLGKQQFDRRRRYRAASANPVASRSRLPSLITPPCTRSSAPMRASPVSQLKQAMGHGGLTAACSFSARDGSICPAWRRRRIRSA